MTPVYYNIDELFKKINFVANKDQTGQTLTGEQYNTILCSCSMEYFQREVERIQNYEIANPGMALNTKEILKGLNVFVSRRENFDVNNGLMNLPNKFVKLLHMDTVYDNKLLEIQEQSASLAAKYRQNPGIVDLRTRPICVREGQQFRIIPRDIDAVDFIYLRTPINPRYLYTLNSTLDMGIYTPTETRAYISRTITSIGTHAIVTAQAGATGVGNFVIAGDQTTFFTPGTSFTVTGSTGNDNQYIVLSRTYGAPNTTIYVTTTIPDGTDDGTINIDSITTNITVNPVYNEETGNSIGSVVINTLTLTSSMTLAEKIAAFVDAINYSDYGFKAVIGTSNSVTIYAPVGWGTKYNASTLTCSYITASGAWTLASGVDGSVQLEWDLQDWLKIETLILEKVGINLRDQDVTQFSLIKQQPVVQ